MLLDSHTLLWFIWEDPQLTPVAKDAIEDGRNRKFVSVVSCWEIAIKAALNKLTLGEPAAILLPRVISDNKFHVLNIELAHVTLVETLQMHHRDPFDRLLIAQALREKLSIVSADTRFDSYAVDRIWD